MNVEISEDTYKAIAQRYGDVSAFIERVAKQQLAGEPTDALSAESNGEKSFADSLEETGLLGCIKEAPADLSTNPSHMEGFGQ